MDFWGYVRENGKVGARNYVAVVPTVVCAAEAAQTICNSVTGCISYLHHQGCCQLPPDLERVTDTLISLCCSPNVGAVLFVSLGCEGTDVERLMQTVAATGKPIDMVRIQEDGGISSAIALGISKAKTLAAKISTQQREKVDASNIVMSIKCGGSDATSGMASNCVIGYVADKVVDLGGTVIFGETGGLTTIEEKSLGAIMKSGSRPIQGVLNYTDMITDQKGLWIKDTPGREPEILTGMACTGAQVMLFSTGRGAPQGFPSMPVLKICGNVNTYKKMEQDMDINAGVIITGESTIHEVGEYAFERMIRILSGEMTKSEAIKYFNFIDIYCMGPVI